METAVLFLENLFDHFKALKTKKKNAANLKDLNLISFNICITTTVLNVQKPYVRNM